MWRYDVLTFDVFTDCDFMPAGLQRCDCEDVFLSDWFSSERVFWWPQPKSVLTQHAEIQLLELLSRQSSLQSRILIWCFRWKIHLFFSRFCWGWPVWSDFEGAVGKKKLRWRKIRGEMKRWSKKSSCQINYPVRFVFIFIFFKRLRIMREYLFFLLWIPKGFTKINSCFWYLKAF